MDGRLSPPFRQGKSVNAYVNHSVYYRRTCVHCIKRCSSASQSFGSPTTQWNHFVSIFVFFFVFPFILRCTEWRNGNDHETRGCPLYFSNECFNFPPQLTSPIWIPFENRMCTYPSWSAYEVEYSVRCTAYATTTDTFRRVWTFLFNIY